MIQDHHVSEKEQAIPFLVIPDVLFTFLVVTTELLFSEHRMQVMISGMPRACLGSCLLCVGVWSFVCLFPYLQ